MVGCIQHFPSQTRSRVDARCWVQDESEGVAEAVSGDD